MTMESWYLLKMYEVRVVEKCDNCEKETDDLHLLPEDAFLDVALCGDCFDRFIEDKTA